MRLGILGDRSSIRADQCQSLVIFIQISLTPGQVATDVNQALEYSIRNPGNSGNPGNSRNPGNLEIWEILEIL